LYSVRTPIDSISHKILHRIPSSIVRVIKKDLGAYPEDLFLNFEEKPIASGS
jgi:predicted unusual protein kinase regulating ubiquinone biosynthesis (AarF/ABC1/UbiB family)